MRAVWVDAGNDPDYTKLAANLITWVYFDIREARLTPAYLETVAAQPGIEGIGVYAVPTWPQTAQLTPGRFAEWVDGELRRIGWSGNPVVMLDIEVPELVPYVLTCLRRWRQLRPKRTTDLTIEGHKGALFGMPEMIEVCKLVRWVVPQCYDGDMHPWDTYAMCADLYAYGFPATKVRPFCSAAALQPWWGIPDGFAFTQGLLP
jgi:hypothetical protein